MIEPAASAAPDFFANLNCASGLNPSKCFALGCSKSVVIIRLNRITELGSEAGSVILSFLLVSLFD